MTKGTKKIKPQSIIGLSPGSKVEAAVNIDQLDNLIEKVISENNSSTVIVEDPEVELTEEQLLKKFILKFAHLFVLDQFQEYYSFSSPIGLIKINRLNHTLSFDMAEFQLTPEEIENFLKIRFELQIDFLKKA